MIPVLLRCSPCTTSPISTCPTPDEDVFDDPFSFDIERDPNQHLAFGIGTHYCIGANLARMEIDVILGAVFERFPNLGLVSGTEPAHRANGLVAGVASMPVRTG